MLLSALESWALAQDKRFPARLSEWVGDTIETLKDEVLK
jgi:hypothetical protein